MEVGTTGLTRNVRSFIDYFVFYDIRLSRFPFFSYIILAIWAAAVLAAAIGGLGWWADKILLKYAALFILLGPLGVLAFKILLADAPSRPRFEKNASVDQCMAKARPARQEADFGFSSLFHSSDCSAPIVLSDRFNVDKLSDPNVDWKLVDCSSDGRYSETIKDLRSMRREYVENGRQSFVRALRNGKALVNEKKVAFAGTFPNTGDCVKVFRTDYFTGICSSDRRFDDVVVREGSATRVISSGNSRFSLRTSEGHCRLPPVAGSSPPISLHLGIEVLAISSDGVLLLPMQSGKASYSRGMRAPSASGSVDWSDTSGAKTLKQMLLNAGRRELAEEWGSGPYPQAPLLRSSLMPVGYFRNAARNGKPQFVAIARLACAAADLRPDPSEIYMPVSHVPGVKSHTSPVRRITTMRDLEISLANILSQPDPSVNSVPLVGAAYCLRSVVTARPKLVHDFLFSRHWDS